MIFDRYFLRLFQILLVLLFAISASGAILGFAGIYHPLNEYIAVILIVAAVLPFVWKQSHIFKEHTSQPTLPRWSSMLLLLCGAVILLVLVFYPLVRWPLSHAGDWFPWDAGAYHFPKAVELYRSTSIWDMSIAYADYPFGYESLLSFMLLLSGDLNLFGPLHGLLLLFFVSAFWLLGRKMTKLDGGLLLFLIAVLLLSDHFFQFLNLWRVFTLDIYTVGKNDLLLATSLLAALFYFYQIQFSYKKGILGFALASSLAASVKPNALYVLFPLWLFLFIRFYKQHLTSLLAHALLLIPGLLWLVRNFIALGSYASADASRLASWSIAANLGNPYFYQHIPKNLLLAGIVVLFEIILAFVDKKEHYWNAILSLVLLVAFISTPVTAYFGDTQTAPNINWRFGEALLVFLALLLWNDIALLLKKIKIGQPVSHVMAISLSIAALLLAGWLLIDQRAMLHSVPENAFILHDQFKESVGVDGYYSAYDYVQRHAHAAVVWVENGLPFYAYDSAFSNTISRQSPPDYVLGFNTDWFGDGDGGFPHLVEEFLADPAYQVVYQDSQGIVLHRR